MITGRHWIFPSPVDAPWTFLLSDGAQAVPIDTPGVAQWTELRRFGIRTVTPVCCGPEAPLPDRWDGWH